MDIRVLEVLELNNICLYGDSMIEGSGGMGRGVEARYGCCFSPLTQLYFITCLN
jgi:hypothetical protein